MINRMQMAELFDEHLRSVTVHFERAEEYRLGQGPLKTYVIEAHELDGGSANDDSAGSILKDLSNRFPMRVDSTEDPTLFVLTKDEIQYFVDTLNPRFWVIHTTANIDNAQTLLDEMIRRSWNLDYAWLPTEVLEHLSRGRTFLGFNVDYDQGLFLSGQTAAQLEEEATVFKTRYWGNGGKGLYDFLASTQPFSRLLCLSAIKYSISEPKSGSYIRNELNYNGRFKATGNSVALHLGAVNHLVSFYSEMIQSLEKALSIEYTQAPEKRGLCGYPLTLRLSQPVPDFGGFVDELLSCRDPIRFWGTVTYQESEFVRAEVVDLHSSSRLRLDLTPSYVRLYLLKGACGNSIVRLVRIIQEHLDPTVRLELESSSIFDSCKRV